jgi:folate-dependent phosphoribosylglycinamide formyltransferase PurN
MPLKPLFNPAEKGRPMRIGAFMSGSGTNITKLLELEKVLVAKEGISPFAVVLIFSDRSDGLCRGEEIALSAGIPYISYDIRKFHQLRKVKRTVVNKDGLAARKDFDQVAAKIVDAFEIDVIALGGYMSYITLNRCINVHPADLSITTPEGLRKYVGDHAVRDAILAGEKVLRSSTLWTDEGVDTGPLLMVSPPLNVILPESLEEIEKDHEKLEAVAHAHQERLKQIGDWVVFPRTLELVSRGLFSLDDDQRPYFDGKAIPGGYREENHFQRS